MLPLLLLRTAQGKACLIELKSGDTFNGILVSVDNWMNMCLKDCIKTSKAGDKFWKCNSIYIRGNQIKYIRLAEEVIDDPALEKHSSNFKTSSSRGRGGRGGDPSAFFDRLDSDKDGSISEEELPSFLKDRLTDIDTDGDKAISKEEFSEALKKMSQ